MKNLLAPILFVFLNSMALIGCVDSLKDTDEANADSAHVSTEDEIAEESLAPNNVSVLIETNRVTLSWNSVESAADYQVHYSRVGSETVSENTHGKTHHSFATHSVETYRVWVTSIFENELESGVSNEVVLISKDKEIATACNECSP